MITYILIYLKSFQRIFFSISVQHVIWCLLHAVSLYGIKSLTITVIKGAVSPIVFDAGE